MSPTLFSVKGFRFFFFSREEPRMHVHIVGHGGEAKYWLEPTLEVAKNHGFSSRQLKVVEAIIEEHEDEIRSAWKKFFNR